MGYSQQGGDLDDLFEEAAILAFARRTTERVGERLKELVEEFSPVASDPFGERSRTPGTLKASWKGGQVHYNGRQFSVEVYTDDPVAPHVEYPTRPHLIRPKPGRGPNARLRFRNSDGDVIYATVVHHPGTKGSYMMTRALAALEEEWPRIAHEEIGRVKV